MYRQFPIWTVFLASTVLVCCEDKSQVIDTSQTQKTLIIPSIQLPFKIRCDSFPGVHNSLNFNAPPPRDLARDTSSFFGKIVKDQLTVLIKNKKDNQSPVLYTIDKYGNTMDTLVLFDKLCYVGVDSQYLPWIEITKDLTIIRTDTSYEQRLEKVECVPPRGSKCLSFVTDTLIVVDKFIIDNNGLITKTK